MPNELLAGLFEGASDSKTETGSSLNERTHSVEPVKDLMGVFDTHSDEGSDKGSHEGSASSVVPVDDVLGVFGDEAIDPLETLQDTDLDAEDREESPQKPITLPDGERPTQRAPRFASLDEVPRSEPNN